DKFGGKKELGGAGTAWHRWGMGAFRVKQGGGVNGLRAAEGEALVPHARGFVMRLRRDGVIEEATADTVLHEGDVVAGAGARDVLVNVIAQGRRAVGVSGGRDTVVNVSGEGAIEVDDPELLSMPVEGVDVLVTNKAVDGKTLAELATSPAARGVFLRKIT